LDYNELVSLTNPLLFPSSSCRTCVCPATHRIQPFLCEFNPGMSRTQPIYQTDSTRHRSLSVQSNLPDKLDLTWLSISRVEYNLAVPGGFNPVITSTSWIQPGCSRRIQPGHH